MWHLKLKSMLTCFFIKSFSNESAFAFSKKFFLESTMKTFINLKVFDETIKGQDSFQTVDMHETSNLGFSQAKGGTRISLAWFPYQICKNFCDIF